VPRAAEWLLVEWLEGETEPTKYWLSTLAEATPIEELVATAKLRWRIERDFEELKQEVGLGPFEGRSGAPLPTARLPPPRQLVHRGVRLSGRRALPLFP
jgi:Transposase DDE domain